MHRSWQKVTADKGRGLGDLAVLAEQQEGQCSWSGVAGHEAGSGYIEQDLTDHDKEFGVLFEV